jgi:hypothetical protein
MLRILLYLLWSDLSHHNNTVHLKIEDPTEEFIQAFEDNLDQHRR